jgi:hypothetical protein
VSLNRYIRRSSPPLTGHTILTGTPMRADIQAIVEEIKQSVGLLRRHL